MYRRKNSLRLKNYNYKSACVYFFTVCVNQHLCLFGDINFKKLKINAAGKMIAKIYTNLPHYYKGLITDTYIVMPNHFHGIIVFESAVGAGLCARPNEQDNTEEDLAELNKDARTGFQSHLKMNMKMDIEYNFMTKDNYKIKIFNNGCQSRLNSGRAQRPAPTDDNLSLGDIIGMFKSYTTTQYIHGVEKNKWQPFYEKLWQRGYYDHIIRNKQEFIRIRKYIINNPLNWKK